MGPKTEHFRIHGGFFSCFTDAFVVNFWGFTSFLLDKKRGPEPRNKNPLLFQHTGCLLGMLIMVYKKSLDLYKLGGISSPI